MSNVREIPLSEVGLETTEQAATRRGQSPATVRKLVADGLVPAVVVGAGRAARYLVRPCDVDAVPIRGKGAPGGNANAKKEVAETPGKQAVRKKPGKKSRNP
ncbi:helix-turn-helix domain-containing protein [Gemmata sp. JC717]|uniref:helix-turn-helix domain-containing protein n=1 Tax=Gemmata algarum TaxID=2975278 RepID=UPI0021BA3D64|nr:helix-turn-helix domain-containing protein [Gemmata algarum]MDY3555283.1 helix-turn-helix domain-containing protein [Gemmata algarum]